MGIVKILSITYINMQNFPQPTAVADVISKYSGNSTHPGLPGLSFPKPTADGDQGAPDNPTAQDDNAGQAPNTPPTPTPAPATTQDGQQKAGSGQYSQAELSILQKYAGRAIDAGTQTDDPPEEPLGITGDADNAHGAPLQLTDLANYLHEQNLITVVPEGFDTSVLTSESFSQLLTANLAAAGEESYKTGYEAGIGRVFDSVPESAYSMLQYLLNSPNATDDDAKAYMSSIVFGASVDALDPADEGDAELIVRQYHTSKGLPPEQVDSLVADEKALNQLKKKASIYHPMLKQDAVNQKAEKLREAERIRQHETELNNFCKARVVKALSGETVAGLKLDPATKNYVAQVILNDTTPVPVKGGKQIETGYMEGLLYQARYTDKIPPDDLILAALILSGKKETVIKALSEKATAKAVGDVKKKMFGTPQAAARAASGGTNSQPNLAGTDSIKRVFGSR